MALHHSWNSHIKMRILVELMVCFCHCVWGKPMVQFTISFPFDSEAYGMQGCNSGMHDSMDEELESCFKGWAGCYCTAHGHCVAWQQGLFSRCWDSHFCFHRRMLHSLSVWHVLILFKESCCQHPRLGKGCGAGVWGNFGYITSISVVTKLRNNF